MTTQWMPTLRVGGSVTRGQDKTPWHRLTHPTIHTRTPRCQGARHRARPVRDPNPFPFRQAAVVCARSRLCPDHMTTHAHTHPQTPVRAVHAVHRPDLGESGAEALGCADRDQTGIDPHSLAVAKVLSQPRLRDGTKHASFKVRPDKSWIHDTSEAELQTPQNECCRTAWNEGCF